jgi:hypothetical protein
VKNGYEILRVKGWDYSDLIATYEESSYHSEEQFQFTIHVNELTQPKGTFYFRIT